MFESRSTTVTGSHYHFTWLQCRMAERQRYEELVKLQDRCNNGYISTDDTEYTTDGTDSEMNDYSEEIIYREKSESSSIMNGDQDYSSIYREECSNRRRSVTSEEVENFCNGNDNNGNNNGKYMNTESVVPVEAKSFLLSMIASQEDILQTIKHLRNTPVLDNLLHGVNSPDCKFAVDVSSPDVGKLTRMRFYCFSFLSFLNTYYYKSLIITYILLHLLILLYLIREFKQCTVRSTTAATISTKKIQFIFDLQIFSLSLLRNSLNASFEHKVQMFIFIRERKKHLWKFRFLFKMHGIILFFSTYLRCFFLNFARLCGWIASFNVIRETVTKKKKIPL